MKSSTLHEDINAPCNSATGDLLTLQKFKQN